MSRGKPPKGSGPGRRVQLHRAISKLGFGSRTQAWDWIRKGEIRVDGHIVTDPLTWIDLDRQQVAYQGQTSATFSPITLAMHKPAGIVTTRSDERGRRTVYDLLPPELPWVFPAGRLDADSEGLLIFTNDSRLSVRLTEPAHRVPKTYQVTVNREVPETIIDKLRKGIVLEDGKTRPTQVERVEPQTGEPVFRMVLTEGRNRQIRRMWEAVGFRVKRLVRTAIGQYPLGKLPAGECRLLDAKEVERLLQGEAGA
jgi:23S rRNA pseudouridine2605 synthase